jgi:cytosine/adenosine deaminase-related metal-dependent hydrolase
VKDIGHFDMDDNIIAEDVIENGVKEVKSVYLRSCLGVGDAIQNGVKHMMWSNDDDDVEEVIQNGVKEVKHKMAESYQQKDHMVTNAIITEDINYAIENGIKE